MTSRWRIIDIITASVLAAAFGVIFWAWGLLWAATGPLFVAFPPAQGILYGMWLMPAVLGALIIGKPGAALYVELVAAVISALLGSQWGLLTLVYGGAQGLAAEIVFAAGRYRHFGAVRALIAGALAGAAAATLDRVLYYPEWSGIWATTYVVVVAASAAVIAGVGSVVLTNRLAQTGALSSFAAGRRARLSG